MDKEVRNLLGLYGSCDSRVVLEGKGWYRAAHQVAKDLVRLFSLNSVNHASGVISVLSPSVQWEVNVKDAFTLCSAGPGDDVKVSTYGPQKRKAYAIRDGDDPIIWISSKTAPKTHAFWQCILNPENAEHVVIDRHALAACVGRNLTDKERGGMLKRVGGYSTYAEVYKDAAKEVGVLPLQMQAACWIQWRNNHA